MLNKKALAAAGKELRSAVGRIEQRFAQRDRGPRPVGWAEMYEKDVQPILEAYHAALPDEGGLIEEARVEAGIWEGETEPAEANPEVLTKLLNRLADALEVARAKLGIDKPEAPEV